MKAPRQAPEKKSASRPRWSAESGRRERIVSRQLKNTMLLGPFRTKRAESLHTEQEVKGAQTEMRCLQHILRYPHPR